ncbi:spore coat protein A [Bacillus thermophilus]|uniref:Spore coat protein A n=1 Tax=Siminovitchia thermophila TaxID=1245522 RepID=A0ABS2R4W1_9BACI|nr:multicopper oxidase [Siminovitchia thermophila]MBM7713953.1 spore coat protein A [Siminovitchia thermophila]ONK23836.1 copper oxidase [Bacillus sp. VT-16-64]
MKTHDKPAAAVDPSKPETIPKFIDDLPIPVTAKPNHREGKDYYEITMLQTKHRFHTFFPPTTVWGFNGQYAGPTIQADSHKPVHIKWRNNLPDKHLLPVDRTLHGVEGNPEVRTVVHLHGAHVSPDSDGNPEAWFSRDFAQTGPAFKRKIYEYPNSQPGATLWYHDHAIGITRLNVYAGLAGFYFIRDPFEKQLNLPDGKYDIPLMIQDKAFHADGSLFYPENSNPPASVNPSVLPFFVGNTITVNGKLWPRLKVEPRKYRLRFLNASNTIGYTLRLGDGREFYQIATDGGLLEKPVKLQTFLLEPAERAEIIVDFSKFQGKKMILQNTNVEGDMGVIMRFDVTLPLSKKDTSQVPEHMRPTQFPVEEAADKIRLLTLSASTDKYNRPVFLLDNRTWDDPVTEKPVRGSTEVWKFINLTDFPHPMHIHLVFFKILHRRPFDLERFQEDGSIVYTGPEVEPEPYERGWKDTVNAAPGMVTSIIMEFKEFTGDYVWHCHILEHEDYDMMRPMKIVDGPEKF